MPVKRVLVIDDDERIADWLRDLLKSEGYVIRTAGSANRALAEFDRNEWDILFLDLLLPDMYGLELLAKLRARRPGFVTVVMGDRSSTSEGFAARKMGAIAFLEKPNDLQSTEILKLLEEVPVSKSATEELPRWSRHGLVGESPGMQTVFELTDTAASSLANVLIVGEPGTGKELLGMAIHNMSTRGQRQLIKLTGLRTFEELAERIIEGNGSTLFVDEVTSIPVELQRRFRLILEEGKIRFVRSRELNVDVRVIASTRFDPERAIREERLSEDLYYRIGVLTIRVPPLRGRGPDVELLISHLVARGLKKHATGVTGIDRDAYDALLHYSWPGNILELEQAIEHAIILAKGRQVQLRDLPQAVMAPRQSEPKGPATASDQSTLILDKQERQAIVEALEKTKWNRKAAAALLGLHRPTLYSKMRKHGISQQRSGWKPGAPL